MDTVSQGRTIGIDVSLDWLDIYCLPDGKRLRLPNTVEGHTRLVDLAEPVSALVCFERHEDQKSIQWVDFPSDGEQEWRLRSALDAAEIATLQLPPAQIKAFATSRGMRAKTDRIDAELIARFMVCRPDAERTLSHQKICFLRALASKREQLSETRKRLLAQIKAHVKLRSGEMFANMDEELKGLLDRQIAGLEVQIAQIIAAD